MKAGKISPGHRSRVAGKRAEQGVGGLVARRLARRYPQADCSLDFASPFQLLISTNLSAQSTDKRVNAVTKPLFERWPTPAALAAASQREVEAVIRSTGFFRAKAKNLRGCAAALVERHGGEVPRRLEDLVHLPGVGRKTANVVLGSGFGLPSGVVVDTHVGRISRRLGLTRHADAVRAERDLMVAVPKSHWIAFSHRLIEHGRTVCMARKPRCEECVLADLCPRVGVKPAAARR
ncbi:MAG: endonuclease III [Planctomycetia bacterium]